MDTIKNYYLNVRTGGARAAHVIDDIIQIPWYEVPITKEEHARRLLPPPAITCYCLDAACWKVHR